MLRLVCTVFLLLAVFTSSSADGQSADPRVFVEPQFRVVSVMGEGAALGAFTMGLTTSAGLYYIVGFELIPGEVEVRSAEGVRAASRLGFANVGAGYTWPLPSRLGLATDLVLSTGLPEVRHLRGDVLTGATGYIGLRPEISALMLVSPRVELRLTTGYAQRLAGADVREGWYSGLGLRLTR